MSILSNFINLTKDKNISENTKEPEDQYFEDACKAYGLSEYAIEQCRQSGISPKEWLKENEPELYKDLDEE